MSLWPTLPPEGAYTDVELNFIDNSPEDFWPDNQDSNFGQFRKVICDRMQECVDFLTMLVNELFPSTSTTYLGMWENEMGLTVNPSSKTVAQRRALVQSRRRKGPFTRTRRARTVEDFLMTTFGDPISLVPEGVALVAGGLPLFGDAANLEDLYVIRENQTADNLATNGNFENNVTGWVASGTSTIATSTTQNKWGLKSMKFTKGTGTTVDYAFTAPAAGQYVVSVWVYIPSGGTITGVTLATNGFSDVSGETDGSADMTKRNQWQRISTVATINTDHTGNMRLTIAGAGAGEIVYFDGFQIEKGATATEFNDPEKTEFYYEVRIRQDHDPGVDLTRELKRITPGGITFDVLLVSIP